MWLNGLELISLTSVSRESPCHEKTNGYLEFEAIELCIRPNICVIPVFELRGIAIPDHPNTRYREYDQSHLELQESLML